MEELIEELKHIKAYARQDQTCLTARQLGDAVARMCDEVLGLCYAAIYAEVERVEAQAEILYALKAFLGYYEQAGMPEELFCLDESEGVGAFDGDEVFNVRTGRAAVARWERLSEEAGDA